MINTKAVKDIKVKKILETLHSVGVIDLEVMTYEEMRDIIYSFLVKFKASPFYEKIKTTDSFFDKLVEIQNFGKEFSKVS